MTSSLLRGRTLALFAAPLALAGSLGCSANVGAEPGAAAERIALVEVREHQTAGDSRAARVDVTARFASIREPGTRADALAMLGLAYDASPAGGCVAVRPNAPASTAVRVDLRDLSPVSVVLRGVAGERSALGLEPRSFPDVAGLVSGVVFVVPTGAEVPQSARSVDVTIGASSTGELELPELPKQLRLQATESDGAYAVDARGVDLSATPLSENDRVMLDVARAGVTRARCGLDSAGRVHIDADSLGGPGDAVLTVRAQRRVQRDDAAFGSLDARLERMLELKLVIR